MKITKQNRKIWLDFYKAAIAYRELECWNWMSNEDIFGVENPESKQIGYCCPTGAIGEVVGLFIYMGKNGYKTWKEIYFHSFGLSDIDQFAMFANQDLIVVEFVDRQEMDKIEIKQIKTLGFKFRGKKQWIQAREHKPGYAPWFITDEQARFCTIALRQAIDVAKRFKSNPSILIDTDKILTRVQNGTKTDTIWEDKYLPQPEVEVPQVKVPSQILVRKAKKELKRLNKSILFVTQIFPSIYGKNKTRPYYPKVILWVDSNSGLIMGYDTFTPKELEKSFEKVFFDKLNTFGFIPDKIVINSKLSGDIVKYLTDALDIDLVFEPYNPLFDEVMEVLERAMGGL